MMLAAVMALKAYSRWHRQLPFAPHSTTRRPQSDSRRCFGRSSKGSRMRPTDLVQAAIVGKDGDVTVVGTGCDDDAKVSDGCVGWAGGTGKTDQTW